MNPQKFTPLNFVEKPVDEMIDLSHAFYQQIKRRRTVRNFSSRPVPDEVIRHAILAAGTAPNGANLQPWHFVVVTDPDKKREIREGAEKEETAFYHERAPEEWLEALEPFNVNENKPFLENAPCLIAIFAKKHSIAEDGTQQKNYYIKESVGIATGMLITAMHFSGLATLTHTPSPMKFLNQILDRPDNEVPFLLLVVGYPSHDAQVPVITKKLLDEIATFI